MNELWRMSASEVARLVGLIASQLICKDPAGHVSFRHFNYE
jgi:hypothetical protein